MSVVADFLKGSVEESLKKILQPAGVVPASVLVLLNLGFLYPTARNDIPVVKDFAALASLWQLVVATSVILIVGYLLLRSANWIIAILAGQTWRASGVNWLLRAWQLRQLRQLDDRLAHVRSADNRADLEWRRATTFPTLAPAERYIQPTRLGNTLVATQHIVAERYGIDMTALWSQMESAESVKDAPSIAAVKDAKATLDLLVNLVFVLAVFVVEAIVYYGYGSRWSDVLTALLVLPVAYVAYRVADTSARAWGNAVEVTFDLHRDKLQEELGLRKSKSAADEHKLWRKASRFFLPGSDESVGDLFDPTTPKTADFTAAPSLRVDNIAAELVDRVETNEGETNGMSSFDLRSVDYLFLISGEADVSRWAGADIIIDDPRVAEITAVPAKTREGAAEAAATIHATNEGSRLSWRVTGLEKGASLTLGYRLPVWRMMVTSTLGTPDVSAVAEDFRLVILGAPGATVNLIFARFGPAVGPNFWPQVRSDGESVPLFPEGELLKSDEIELSAQEQAVWISLPKERVDVA